MHLAWKFLVRRGKKSAGLAISIAIGIAALLLVTTLALSIESALGKNVRDLLSSDIMLYEENEGMIQDCNALIHAVTQHPDVAAASPRIRIPALITYGERWENVTAVALFGIDVVGDEKVASVSNYVIQGNYSLFREKVVGGYVPVLVGSTFAKRHGLCIYDGKLPNTTNILKITAGKYREVNGEFTPIVMECVIICIFESEIPFFDASAVFIPIEAARQMLDYSPYNPKATTILVKLKDRRDAERVLGDLLNLNSTGTALRGETGDEVISNFLEPAFRIIRPVEYLIVGISLTATFAKIGYSAGVSMRERKRDVGLMRAIGLSKAKIFAIYLEEHGIIGLGGGLLGAVVACALGFILMHSNVQIYTLRFAELTLLPSVKYVAAMVLLSFSMSLAASAYVIYKTASLSIVKAMIG